MSLRFGTNEIIIHKNYAEIVMKGGNSLIDIEDIELVSQYRWCMKRNRTTTYARSSTQKYLHRILMQPKDKEVIDHINRNGLDNRRCNLRITNQKMNTYNSQIRSNNSTGVTGVYKNKISGKFYVQIAREHLGTFDTFEEAKEVRQKAERCI